MAARPVAGRPLVLRALVGAARAGAAPLLLPAALRTAALEAWIARTPALRGRVQWLAGDRPPAPGRWLLLPATAPVEPGALRPLLDAPGAALVLAGTPAVGAPILVAPAEWLQELWPALAAGAPLGARLAAASRALPELEPAGPVEAVADEAGRRRAEAWLYATLCGGEDSTLDRRFHRRLSLPLTRALVRTALSPNQVSLASLAVGLGAIWAAWHATPASAALAVALYALATVIDHSDGELARLTFQESPLGAQLDWVIDTVIHAGLVLAIGVTAGGGLGAGLGAAAALGVTMSAVLARSLPDWEKAHSASPDRVLKDMGNRDLFYAVLVGFATLRWAWPGALPALVLVVALGSQSYWLACLGRIRAGRVRRPV
jgi:phosphatidylglycerophosphate synthase